jgi:hypothetical protein
MSSSSSTLDLQVELGNTFGALFIGVVLAAMLVSHLLVMQMELVFRLS